MQSARSRFNPRARTALLLAATGLLALGSAGLFLAWHWPFGAGTDLPGSAAILPNHCHFHKASFHLLSAYWVRRRRHGVPKIGPLHGSPS